MVTQAGREDAPVLVPQTSKDTEDEMNAMEMGAERLDAVIAPVNDGRAIFINSRTQELLRDNFWLVFARAQPASFELVERLYHETNPAGLIELQQQFDECMRATSKAMAEMELLEDVLPSAPRNLYDDESRN